MLRNLRKFVPRIRQTKANKEFIEGTENPLAPWSSTDKVERIRLAQLLLQKQVDSMDEDYCKFFDDVFKRLDKLENND